MKTKKCRICKENKSIEKFHSRKGSKDGCQNACMKCRNASNKRLSQKIENIYRLHVFHSRKRGFTAERGNYALTLDFFIAHQDDACSYCGKPRTGPISFDRRNNFDGYFPYNCLAACTSCNSRKGAKSYEEFMRLIGRV